ncbi:MAG: tetratricopeptide repeat protein [Candidatus Aminicenantes bacterium]|nr:tetratricopeptide repeat protein [Candidatus Aminicenantes bacterium]
MNRTAIVLLGLCFSLAACASSQKKLQEAREKDPQYQYSLGAFQLNSNNLDDAQKYFQRAIALDSRHFQSWNALGLVYSMKGDFAEAEKALLKCLEISPGFVEARNNLGMVYQEMGFPDRAEAEFKKVLADPAYPTKESPYYNLARLYSIRQDWDNALFYAEKAIQANPRYHMGHAMMGLILERQEKFSEAVNSYKEALRLVPDDVSYSFSLASAHFKGGEWHSAEEILEKILPRITDPEMKKDADSYLKSIREKMRIQDKSYVPSSHASR